MHCSWVIASLFVLSANAAGAIGGTRPPARQKSDPQPQYYALPPLREQASIQDAWVKERRDGIPKLLRKHGVDAWLVSVGIFQLFHSDHVDDLETHKLAGQAEGVC